MGQGAAAATGQRRVPAAPKMASCVACACKKASLSPPDAPAFPGRRALTAAAAPLSSRRRRSDGTIGRAVLFVDGRAEAAWEELIGRFGTGLKARVRQGVAALRRAAAWRAGRGDRAGGLLPPAGGRQPAPAPAAARPAIPGRRLSWARWPSGWRSTSCARAPRSAAATARRDARRASEGRRPGNAGAARRARRTGGGPAGQSRRAGAGPRAPAALSWKRCGALAGAPRLPAQCPHPGDWRRRAGPAARSPAPWAARLTARSVDRAAAAGAPRRAAHGRAAAAAWMCQICDFWWPRAAGCGPEL